jgi:hypothetical protein
MQKRRLFYGICYYYLFFVQGTPTPKNAASANMDPAPVELFDAAGNREG